MRTQTVRSGLGGERVVELLLPASLQFLHVAERGLQLQQQLVGRHLLLLLSARGQPRLAGAVCHGRVAVACCPLPALPPLLCSLDASVPSSALRPSSSPSRPSWSMTVEESGPSRSMLSSACAPSAVSAAVWSARWRAAAAGAAAAAARLLHPPLLPAPLPLRRAVCVRSHALADLLEARVVAPQIRVLHLRSVQVLHHLHSVHTAMDTGQ